MSEYITIERHAIIINYNYVLHKTKSKITIK